MSTSLREQLTRLAAPQTVAITDSRFRASILFDAAEAATKDRKTIYELGCAGLQELIALNSSFQQFEATLFDAGTLQLERSMERSDFNKVLDKNIAKFLHHLSPYFMLRPTHMCLEWLLRRFLIHEYNKQAVLALILPYHETNMFVKVLQVLRIRKADDELTWLKPLQKPGLALAKSTIVNRAASNPAFLTFVCKSTMDAVHALDTRAHALQAQINFYATVVVGALDSAGSSLQEWHITCILPSLLKGLSSSNVDFQSAAYIIISQLVSHTKLTSKLIGVLIAKVSAVQFEQLRTAAVLLLIWIFDTQAVMQPTFTPDALQQLLQHKWLTGVISTLAKEGVAVHPLCVALIRSAVQGIAQHSEAADTLKLFLERLLYDVEFNNEMAHHIISSFLDTFVAPSKSNSSPKPQVARSNNTSVIELDSDDDMDGSNDEYQSWYSDYLMKLERQYPVAFDATIKEALQANAGEDNNRSQVIKMALGYRLKAYNADATDIYEQLYHHTAKIREHAIKSLLANLSDYQARPQNLQLLKECLADRIVDDSEDVVAAVLTLPNADFISILGCDRFVAQLFDILHKAQKNNERWEPLLPQVIKHLTHVDIVEKYDANLLLLALMPVIFPSVSSAAAHHNIALVLQSALVQKIGFLQELQLSKKADNFSASDFKRQFLNVISASQETPAAMELLQSVQTAEALQQSPDSHYFKLPTHFAHFLLLTTACLKQELVPSDSLKLFERMRSYSARYSLKHMQTQEWQLLNRERFIPLQLFADFLQTLTRQTQFKQLQNSWQQPSDELRYFLQLLQLLSTQAFGHTQPAEKQEWSKTLKDLFSNVFTQQQQQLEFLSNFYVYEQLDWAELADFAALRVRAFKLFNASVVAASKQPKYQLPAALLLKLLLPLQNQAETLRLQAAQTLQCVYEADVLDATLQQFVGALLERRAELCMDAEQLPLVLYTLLQPSRQTRAVQQRQSKQLLQHFMCALTEDMAATKTTTTPKSTRAKKTAQLVATTEKAVTIQNATLKAQLLQLLKHINDEQLLKQLLPLALQLLEVAQLESQQQQSTSQLPLLPVAYSSIYELLALRFDAQNIENVLVDDARAWCFFERSFENYQLLLQRNSKLLPLPCVLLETLDASVYAKMPPKYQLSFIQLLVKMLAVAENDKIFLAANKLLRSCLLECEPLVPQLLAMCEQQQQQLQATKTPTKATASGTAAAITPSPQLQLHSAAWREGIVLLELLEHKKLLSAAHCLIAPLFALLKHCLDQEDQSAVEYAKQLALSALLHSAQLAGDTLPTLLPANTVRIELLVQCVRASANPQTHHNALLLLAHCAALYPQQVLHNIVDIFTFMGSTLVRHDDAYSFHIINQIVEAVVPILVQNRGLSNSNNENAAAAVLPVLKVFSDIMLDVPAHRRLPLYTKLLHTLDASTYTWMFLCVVFEAHVIDDEKQRKQLLNKGQNVDNAKSIETTSAVAAPSNNNFAQDKLSKRLKIALSLCGALTPQQSLQTCIALMHYIRQLPESKETASTTTQKSATNVESQLFDVSTRSARHLRHYKYVIMQFLSNFSSSRQFLLQLAQLDDATTLAMKPYYQNFIIKTLSYVPHVNACLERLSPSDVTLLKFWRVILHHVHDVLDNAISLLTPDMFLVVVHGLLQHQLLSVRKKVIELFISKLQLRDAYFESCDAQLFANLLTPLSDIVAGILTPEEEQDKESTAAEKMDEGEQKLPETINANELVQLQQTALIAIKLLSKLFALQHIEQFKLLLTKLSKLSRERSKISKILFATIILTMIEICANLKAHSLAHLPKFMPQLMVVLRDQAEFVRQSAPDNITLAIITGIQKLFESLPLFLGPYTVEIITALSSISNSIVAQLTLNPKDQRAANVQHKITAIWTRIASAVPVRILVPACEKSYSRLMYTKNYADVGVLMKLLNESIAKTNNTDLASVQIELCDFFMTALEYRTHLASSHKYDKSKVSATELCIIDAFVAWVLKLSESAFRPIYYRLYEWALKGEQCNERTLTYFLLTNKIADALKSLFVLFAGDFMQDAADLLQKHNTKAVALDGESDVDDADDDDENESEDEAPKKPKLVNAEHDITVALLQAILSTLYNVFLHDSKGFINAHRFDLLMQPIVDQLECRLVLAHVPLQQMLTACIAQLAVAVSSDILWKQLNQQVLLKTRNHVPEVRMLAFNCCVAIARKLGDDFSTLLPETVPFIAELFEDENTRVEQNTRKAVQELEAILGESLQKYL